MYCTQQDDSDSNVPVYNMHTTPRAPSAYTQTGSRGLHYGLHYGCMETPFVYVSDPDPDTHERDTALCSNHGLLKMTLPLGTGILITPPLFSVGSRTRMFQRPGIFTSWKRKRKKVLEHGVHDTPGALNQLNLITAGRFKSFSLHQSTSSP